MKVMANNTILSHILLSDNPSKENATTEKDHFSLGFSKYGANPKRTPMLLANDG